MLLGLIVAVVVSMGVLAPQATAAPVTASVVAGQAVPAAGGVQAAVAPADILGDAWDWTKERAGQVGSWIGSKLHQLGQKTGDALKVVTDPVGTVASAVNNAAAGWVQEALEQAAIWVAATLGKAVAWIMSMTLALIFTVNAPNLDADFMYTWSGRVLAFAIPITVLFALYQIMITSLQMRGLAGLRRAMGGALFGTAASMVTLPVVAVIANGIDGVKTAFINYLELDTEVLSQKLVDIWSSDTFTALAEASPTGAAAGSAMGISFMLIAFCFMCFFTLLFACSLMVIMVVRNIMLHGVVAVSPLAWSGLAAEPTRSWPRTILGWIAAILVAPIGVVLILGLSISALGNLDSPDTLGALVGQIIMAGGMFLLALFVPFACFTFFNFAGEAAVAGMHRDTQDGMEEGGQTVGDTIKTVAAAAAAAGAAAGAGVSGSGTAAGEAAGGEAAAGQEAASTTESSGTSSGAGGKVAEAASSSTPTDGDGGGDDGGLTREAERAGNSATPPPGEAGPDAAEYYNAGYDPGVNDWGDDSGDSGAQPAPDYYGPDPFDDEETSSAWEEA
ncbi:hypothetical protein [Actinomyces sp.]|uniref:hypothetical protein n=1 Tax=Actinomyces sp. TaxID=29317 RepID=UPI0026DABAEC|nr:hypothetical protein [Actinomyces sp.]MDO4899444.1 hypothetical protein [Actinomyces sp.]